MIPLSRRIDYKFIPIVIYILIWNFYSNLGRLIENIHHTETVSPRLCLHLKINNTISAHIAVIQIHLSRVLCLNEIGKFIRVATATMMMKLLWFIQY